MGGLRDRSCCGNITFGFHGGSLAATWRVVSTLTMKERRAAKWRHLMSV
jgi:hypothetical protein